MQYKPFASSSLILEAIKKVLVTEKNIDSNCISLYDVSELMKSKQREYDELKETYQSKLGDIVESKYPKSLFCVHDFDYEKNELNIGFRRHLFSGDWKHMEFSKKDGDLYGKKSDSVYANEILALLGNDLSKLYDEFMDYSKFKQQYSYRIRSTNLAFLVNISSRGLSGVEVCHEISRNFFVEDFKLSSYLHENGYECNCNSNNVLNVIRGNEEEIFKKIFVRIYDCPEWSRETLYEIRKNQIEEEQKEERRKQKKLKLKRMFFPFLKDKL